MPGELESISKKMKELVDGMKSSFQKASSNISGHIGDVMSDEIKMTTETIKSVGASAKDSSLKILKFFGTGWTLELKSFAVDKKQLDVLKDIKKQGQEEKLSRLAKFKKTKGANFLAAILDMLGIPLAILAAGIGALVGQILLPFKGIWKVVKPFFLPFKFLFDLLAKSRIGQLFRAIKKSKFFVTMVKMFKFLMKLPGIRVILKGLKWGFKKLLWPLQILLSIIDFAKGFMRTQGTIWEKIKGGIKNVIMEFLKFPLFLFGKLLDWITGDEAGTGEKKLTEGLSKLIDDFFFYFDKVFGPIKDAFFWLVDKIKNLSWKDILKTINDMNKWVEELPFRMWNWLQELWQKAKYKLHDWSLGVMGEERPETGEAHLKAAQERKREEDRKWELELKKYEEQKKIAENTKKALEKQGIDSSAFISEPKPPELGLPVVKQVDDAAINAMAFGGGSDHKSGGSGIGF